MRHLKWLWIALTLFLCACSPIDSVKPFDDTQAAILIKENMVQKRMPQMISLRLPADQTWLRTHKELVLQPTTVYQQTIQTDLSAYRYHPRMTAQRFLQNRALALKDRCRQAVLNIFSENLHDSVYQFTLRQCRDMEDQTQIGKIFNGIDAVYGVRYINLEHGANPKQIAVMKMVIANSQLINRY